MSPNVPAARAALLAAVKIHAPLHQHFCQTATDAINKAMDDLEAAVRADIKEKGPKDPPSAPPADTPGKGPKSAQEPPAAPPAAVSIPPLPVNPLTAPFGAPLAPEVAFANVVRTTPAEGTAAMDDALRMAAELDAELDVELTGTDKVGETANAEAATVTLPPPPSTDTPPATTSSRRKGKTAAAKDTAG